MIKTLLENIESCSDQLYQCLSDEHDALRDNQYESIMSLAEQKQSLVGVLNELDQQRLQLSGTTDFAQFLSRSRPDLSQVWQTLREKIQRCQQQNEVNGRILNRRNQIARDTLNILTGRSNDDETTYGPSGKANIPGPKLTNTQV
ncbi:MAG: flagella synthesis protein FlgN [Gammaproteobacteria bacterium]